VPLPDASIAWPPKPFDTAYAAMATWDAWYVGKPETLHDVYRRRLTARPAQFSGGVVGAVARWFWGRPTPAGQSRTRLHVPLPADIATTSADLLFSEVPSMLVDGGTQAAQERLDVILDDGVHTELLEAAEVAAALGGAYLRVQWDAEIADHAFLDAVSADAAIPEFRWGRLAAVTFWHEVDREPGMVLRHLERHERGAIYHALYQGSDSELGRPVPLAEHPSTADLQVNAEGYLETGSQRLTAVHIPNMRPNRTWRSMPDLAALGRSDFDGIEPIFDALDETYSSWMRDVRLGRARILVPEAYLENNGPGRGATFDEDREVFASLNMLPKPGGAVEITPNQFAIRWAEHQATAQALVEQAVRAAGYSASTFGETDGDNVITATEVHARQQRSLVTREKKTRYWTAALRQILPALLDVDQAVFASGAGGQDVAVEFPAAVQPDQQQLAATAELLSRAQAASAETLVAMVHPDWDEQAVAEEAARIASERSFAMPDPLALVPDEAQA
jgi:A118 family predicted phage portal protein